MPITIPSNKPKPYTVLTEVDSETGSWKYEIRVSHKTGVEYCTCKGHQFNKKCKHMDAYRANPTIKVPNATMLPQPKRNTPGDILRDELAMLGLTISQSSATVIANRILSSAGKASAGTSSTGIVSEYINANNVRVIVLPD